MGTISQALDLYCQLKGKSLRIPNLWPIFQKWPCEVSPCLDRLRQHIEDALENTIKDQKKRDTLKSCGFGFLTAWAEWDELCVSGTYMLWIFLWDDEIDDGFSEASQNEDHAKAYVRQSLKYAHSILGLTKTTAISPESALEECACPIPTMVYFRDACQIIANSFDTDQRQRLYDEICHYMNWTTKEQVINESGQVLAPTQYLELRNWTSGIYPVIAMFEYITRIRFDQALIDSKPMQIVWKETCFLCMIINDIHSVVKELPSGSVLNAIPVFFHANQNGDIDSVLKLLEGLISSSVSRFDQAAAELESALDKPSMRVQIQLYLDICRTTVTGLLTWSLLTKRYGLARYRQSDGSVAFKL